MNPDKRRSYCWEVLPSELGISLHKWEVDERVSREAGLADRAGSVRLHRSCSKVQTGEKGRTRGRTRQTGAAPVRGMVPSRWPWELHAFHVTMKCDLCARDAYQMCKAKAQLPEKGPSESRDLMGWRFAASDCPRPAAVSLESDPLLSPLSSAALLF